MSRLLWLSDTPTCTTGMAIVTRHVLKRLRSTGRFKILCRSWGYREEAYDTTDFPYEIQPAVPHNQDAPAMAAAIQQFQPDFVVTLGDVWNFNWLTILPELQQTRWIGYYPLDAGPVMRSCVPILERTDVLVACADFGKQLIEAAVPGKPVEMIYHGVDSTVFRPLPKDDDPGDEFVVGFVGRNQPRKQIPTLIKAFARFAKDKPDAFLYLHTSAIDCGWDLPELIERYALQEKSVISGRAEVFRGVPDEELNAIYNSFDVFVLPSNGEGFGLPTLEAMAAGVPVVVTGSSASMELVEGRGELIRVATHVTSCQGNVEVAYPDEDHLVENLEKLYRDPELRREYGRKGRAFAESLDWDRIVQQWEALFDRVMEMPFHRETDGWK